MKLIEMIVEKQQMAKRVAIKLNSNPDYLFESSITIHGLHTFVATQKTLNRDCSGYIYTEYKRIGVFSLTTSYSLEIYDVESDVTQGYITEAKEILEKLLTEDC